MTDFYKGKKVLVTGGTGTIGVPLVKKLINLGADVTVVSIDSPERVRSVFGTAEFFRYGDLRKYEACLDATKRQDFVFHLVAVKGCTTIGTTKVASAFVPLVLSNTNMMEAAFRCGVSRFLFVGSICEYPALDLRHEDDVWNGLPQANDRYTGIAKRTGEAQGETYLHEYGWDAVRIVRPSNVYGPYDDFDPKTAQVIPALIRRMVDGENPVEVWGDGSAVRDFIYSEDVADAMLLSLEKAPCCVPINIGSGHGFSIKLIAETIADLVPKQPRIGWSKTAPTGDKMRVLSTERAKELLGFEPKTGIKAGIAKTIQWYLANTDVANRRGGSSMGERQRQCCVPFEELVDMLTIDQIKEILIDEHRESFSEEISHLIHDIGIMIRKNKTTLNARFIRLTVILAQINLHIWHAKEIMMNDAERFEENMKLAHQLNGIRNQIKNVINAEFGLYPTSEKTNISTDKLEGWKISI